MRIMTSSDQTDHAWLEGEAVADELAGIRFRIIVGMNGGFACDQVETGHELTPFTRVKLALDAAWFISAEAAADDVRERTDPTHVRRVGMTTSDGRQAWAAADGESTHAEIVGDLSKMTDHDLAIEDFVSKEQGLGHAHGGIRVVVVTLLVLAAAEAACWKTLGALPALTMLIGFATTGTRKLLNISRVPKADDARQRAAIAREWERRLIAGRV